MSEAAPDSLTVEAQHRRLERAVARAESIAARVEDRVLIENLFSRYMYLHNAFSRRGDHSVVGEARHARIRAQYSNLGAHETWESVTATGRRRLGSSSSTTRSCRLSGPSARW